MTIAAIADRVACAVLAVLLAFSTISMPCTAQATEEAYAVPAITDDGWQVRALGESGFDIVPLRTLLDAAMGSEANLHSIIIERHGFLVAELYRNGKDKSVYSLFARRRAFGPEVLHDTRSVGKSVIGLLIGIAQAQEKIGVLSTPVLDFFPEYSGQATSEHRAITLQHLLTMSSGLQWHEGGAGRDDEHRLFWKRSPYRYVLRHPVALPAGERFNYNGGGTALLAEVVARTTQSRFTDFAREHLFEPLGIRDWQWVSDLHGRPMAFNGLRMRPRDMAKLGRLLLNQGSWQGRQIVPAAWVAATLQPRISTGIADLQYGYHWWAGTVQWQDKPLAWSAAFGNGGQRVFVVPDLDLTVVFTAGAYGDPRSAPYVNALFKGIVATIAQ
jgi:CubicO group peptidase (beta-lactamase class C family)